MQLEIRYREDLSDGSTQWRVVERVGLTPGSVTRHDGDTYGPFTTEGEARKFARYMIDESRRLNPFNVCRSGAAGVERVIDDAETA